MVNFTLYLDPLDVLNDWSKFPVGELALTTPFPILQPLPKVQFCPTSLTDTLSIDMSVSPPPFLFITKDVPAALK